MHTSHPSRRLFRAFHRVAFAAVVAGAVTFSADAQQPSSSVPSSPQPAVNLQAALKAPLDLSTASDSLGYSSSSGAAETAAAVNFNVAGDSDLQPPPRRRRYGRPNYNDRMHNTDGSNKIAFVAGGGMSLPVGATGKRTTLSYGLKAGVGYNMSKKLGILAEYNYDRFGLQGAVLANQTTIYNQYIRAIGGTSADLISGLDGNTHVWSLTLNPTLTLVDTEHSSLYFVFGGGFYRKVVTFTVPGVAQYCDYYYGCYTVQANQTFDHYSNNAGGVNGGIGITHKFSRFTNERFFAEARYVQVFNSTSNNSVHSLYPPANARTGYIPITVGLRF